MKIGGASLGELLRHGSQFGLGVQDASRQNMMNQQAMEKQRREELQQAILDQAELDRSQASTAESRARTKSLLAPEPPRPLTQAQISGRLREWRARNPNGRPDAAMAEVGGVPGFDPGLGWEAWADLTKPPTPEKPTEAAQGFSRRKQALAANGVTGPEADAIASDETLFRSWYNENLGSGDEGDPTGQRQRVMAVYDELMKLRQERATIPSISTDRLAANSNAAATALRNGGYRNIEDFVADMKKMGGQEPAGGMEDPLGIR